MTPERELPSVAGPQNAERVIVAIVGGVNLALCALTLLWPEICGECQEVSEAFYAGAIAKAGFVYYAALVVATCRARWFAFAVPALALAVGVHAVLLTVLHRQDLSCRVCVAAAGIAALGLGLAAALRRAGYARVALCLLAGAFAAQTASALHTRVQQGRRAAALGTAQADALKRFAPPPGRVAIVIYEAPNCGYCRQAKRDAAALQAEFRGTVQVHVLPTEEHLPRPTIVVVAAVPVVFAGKPPQPELRAAVLDAMGSGAR